MPVRRETCTKRRQNQLAKSFVAVTSTALVKIGILQGLWKHKVLGQLWTGSTNAQEEVNILVFRIILPQQISRGCKPHQTQSCVSDVVHFGPGKHKGYVRRSDLSNCRHGYLSPTEAPAHALEN